MDLIAKMFYRPQVQSLESKLALWRGENAVTPIVIDRPEDRTASVPISSPNVSK